MAFVGGSWVFRVVTLILVGGTAVLPPQVRTSFSQKSGLPRTSGGEWRHPVPSGCLRCPLGDPRPNALGGAVSGALVCCAGWTSGTGLPEPGTPHAHWATGHSRVCVVKRGSRPFPCVHPTFHTAPSRISVTCLCDTCSGDGPLRGGWGVSPQRTRDPSRSTLESAPHAGRAST